MDLQNLRNNRKVITKFKYELKPIDKGYNNRTLYVNVGENIIKEKPVSQQMKDKFIGGKGFGLRLLWDATKPETKWNDPDNEVVIAGGPICGITQYSGTGKSIVVGISPQTDSIMDSNVGGFFGPYSKFSGFDAVELQGISDKEVIVFINGIDGEVEIFEAPEGLSYDSHLLGEELHEMFADNERDKYNIAVVSSGAAAKHSLIGMLNFTFYDMKRKVVRLKQAGRGGLGTIFRQKNILAVVCKIGGVKGNLNNVVNLEAIQERGRIFNKEMRDLDDSQCQMRAKGTAHLVEIMDAYDLLPTHNFKFGKHV
ncbi:MAG: aldehyde ferredoxin oxidoreductase N-terminal domain-containing protein, partial [Bacteroidota bacterium]